jgi:CheY-like chemotaxis protein/HPt (histidine-containing phosphotransfer) domain-containing protein
VELIVDSERSGNDVWLGITVKDTGIGITKDELPNLFDEYYQADTKTNRKTEGTGLGLSITRKLVELMDGQITVESEYGKGTIFHLRLRQGFVDNETIGNAVVENLSSFNYSDTKRLMSRKLVRANLGHFRVLVVDDMQTNLVVTAGLMQKYHLKVDCVTSGQASIDRISKQSTFYDAIFMDHMMPGMNGIEAAKGIRSLETEYAKNIPIIALTANAVLGSDAMFYKNGFQDFLSKPIDIMRLDAVLNKWVRDRVSPNHIPESHTDAPPSGLITPPTPTGGAVTIPGIDDKRVSYLYDGDMEIFLPVLRSYAAHSLNYLDKLRGATEDGLRECVTIAHGIKGASANICAEAVRATAAEMEACARNGDFAKFLALRGPFLEDATRLINDINAWLENYDKSVEKPLLEAPSVDILKELRQSCKAYDMSGIDKAMDALESSNYKSGGDLVEWLREKIDTMEVEDVIARLSKEPPFVGG